jgi:hypothetical protein
LTTSTNSSTADATATLQAYSLAPDELTISSSQLIRQVKVYDIVGRILVNQSLQMLHTTTTVSAPTGVCLVEAILYDGTSIFTQTIVK